MDRHTPSSPDESRAALAAQAAQFTLVRGGLFYRVLATLGLARATETLPVRRALAFAAAAWLPLLFLTAVEGRLVHRPLREALITDFATQARSLVAIPMLVLAEHVVDARFRLAVRSFIDGNLIRPDQYGAFRRTMADAQALKNSVAAHVFFLLLAFAGSWTTATRIRVLNLSPWVGPATGGPMDFYPAGWWQLGFNRPLFQFLLWLWIWRWASWTKFLWRASRLNLQLVATHPDRAAGLGIVAEPSAAFAMVVFALAAILSGEWCHRLLYDHEPLASFQPNVAVFAALALAVGLAPLVVFAGPLYAVKHRDGIRYSSFVQEYMLYFDRRWIGHASPHDEATLERVPAETTANLGQIDEAVRRTRLVPFGKATVVRLVAGALVPMAPLALAAVPLTEIAQDLVKLFV